MWKVAQELPRHSSAPITMDVYTQAMTPGEGSGPSKVIAITPFLDNFRVADIRAEL